MSLWWLVLIVPGLWCLGFAWACKAYLLGYRRGEEAAAAEFGYVSSDYGV